MRDPRITGISAITGRIVSIQHASGIDREIIAEKAAAAGGRSLDLTTADIVVAVENERPIGFAILERGEGDGRTPRLTHYEHGRRRGIGRLILQHLLEHSKVKTVLAGRESAAYLGFAGFRRRKGGTRAHVGPCSVRGAGRPSTAVYERR